MYAKQDLKIKSLTASQRTGHGKVRSQPQKAPKSKSLTASVAKRSEKWTWRSTKRKKLQKSKFAKKNTNNWHNYNYDVNVRFCDHPRPGSIFRLPDIPQIVRGPTLVLLPSGKEITVPASAKHEVVAEADIHNATEGNLKLESLLKLLTLKDSTKRALYCSGAMQHPREGLRLANHMGMNEFSFLIQKSELNKL